MGIGISRNRPKYQTHPIFQRAELPYPMSAPSSLDSCILPIISAAVVAEVNPESEPVAAAMVKSESEPKKRKPEHRRTECHERDEDGQLRHAIALEPWSSIQGYKRMEELRQLVAKADADMRKYETAALISLDVAKNLVPESMAPAEGSWERHTLFLQGRLLIAEAWASHESKVEAARAAIDSVQKTDYDNMLKTPRLAKYQRLANYHCRVVFDNVSMERERERCFERISAAIAETMHINDAFFAVPTLNVQFVDNHFVLTQQ